jgi:hypothetical protein
MSGVRQWHPTCANAFRGPWGSPFHSDGGSPLLTARSFGAHEGVAELRLRKVEYWQHWYSGLAAAIGALIGVGGAHTITH